MEIFTVEAALALLSLTALEIVLGIDNIVFIAILSQRLPEDQQPKIRQLGLVLALFLRLGLLFALSWIMGLTKPWFEILGHGISGRDLVMFVGGLFLIGKSVHEIYEKLEVEDEAPTPSGKKGAFANVLIQILALDVVFSLDSVITAVGMAKQLWVMVTAMVIAVAVMLVFAGKVSDFINKHPSMKVLGLSFLLLIGVLLVAEGMGQHVSKGTIYFAMGFALFIELLNMRLRKKSDPRPLHQKYVAPE